MFYFCVNNATLGYLTEKNSVFFSLGSKAPKQKVEGSFPGGYRGARGAARRRFSAVIYLYEAPVHNKKG